MASLLHSLPAPTRRVEQDFELAAPAAPRVSSGVVPPYLKREGFVPRRKEDFGDGGAFPEIHVSQYPLDMGRPKKAGATSTAIVAVDVDGTFDRCRGRGRAVPNDGGRFSITTISLNHVLRRGRRGEI